MKPVPGPPPPARSRFRPPRTLRTTRSGRVYLIVTIGIGLGALNTGNNLLYLVLGFLLSLIIASGVLSERCLKDIEVRRLAPDGAFAAEPFAVRYEVLSRRRSVFALWLNEEGLAPQTRAWIGLVTRDGRAVGRATYQLDRRGPQPLTGVAVTTAFPFGLFEKTRTFTATDTLVIFPRRGYVCQTPPHDNAPRAGDGRSARARDGSGDLAGLSEVRVGEDARRIHWRKSAAARKLLRVEREREERRQYTVNVDVTLPLEQLDHRCEEVAAQCERLLTLGHEVGLAAGTQRIRPSSGPGHSRRLLHALALAGYE